MLDTKIRRVPLLAIVVTSLGLAMGSCSVTTWDSVTPRYTPETAPHVTQWRPADTALYSVRAFGKNSFYAVGQAGTILRSVDGKRWLTQFSGTQADLHSIFGTADGKELWAVGDLETILHSGDGEHWKSQLAGGFTLRCVFGTADGKQLWAVGDFGTILRSTDGEHWIAQHTDIKNASLHSIFGTADGKQLWAVGDRGTILHSSDGEHWNAQDSNTQVALDSIFGTADGKRLWVVGNVGQPAREAAPQTQISGTILHSADGEHWSASNVGMQAVLHSIFGTSDGKQLWAVGETLKRYKRVSPNSDFKESAQSPGVIFHSTDGEHWSVESTGTRVLNSIAGTPDGRQLCAVGGVNSGSAILYSDGGKQWTTEPRGTNANLYGISATPDGKQMWATGENSTILHSSDGDNWSTQYKGPQGILYSIFGAEDGKHLWAVGATGGTLAPDGSLELDEDARGTIVHSLDGEHWTTTEATRAKGSLNSVFGTPDGKKLWAVGDRRTILHSADGEHWTVQDSKTTGGRTESDRLGQVVILNSIFGTRDGKNLWAVGTEDTVAMSSNGFVSMSDPELFKKGYLEALTWPRLKRATILHTIDGEHWTIEDSNTGGDLYSIFGTRDGKQLWAVGCQPGFTDPGFLVKSTGMIVHSTDGEHWSVQETTEHCLNSVFGTPDGKNLWAVGNDGAILHSTDGEHWASQFSHSGGDLFFVFGTPGGKRLWVFG